MSQTSGVITVTRQTVKVQEPRQLQATITYTTGGIKIRKEIGSRDAEGGEFRFGSGRLLWRGARGQLAHPGSA